MHERRKEGRKTNEGWKEGRTMKEGPAQSTGQGWRQGGPFPPQAVIRTGN
jgi:hypothetical protein